MQRVIVMGPPGSGKSTLARRLGAAYGLPVLHLDQASHLPGWVAVAPDLFAAEVERMAALPAWVIDGNYIGSIAARIRNADAIIYLDVSRWLSMLRVMRRLVTGFGQVRDDSAAGCPERLDLEFLQFVWNWNRIRRASHMAIVEAFGGEKIILRGSRQQRQFLRVLPGGGRWISGGLRASR